MIMNLNLLFFLKGKKKSLITEIFLVFFLLIFASSFFINYLYKFNVSWNNLLNKDQKADLECVLTQPFEVYLSTNSILSYNLKDYDYLTFKKFPSNLTNLSINNQEIVNYNLVTISDSFFKTLNESLSLSTIYFSINYSCFDDSEFLVQARFGPSNIFKLEALNYALFINKIRELFFSYSELEFVINYEIPFLIFPYSEWKKQLSIQLSNPEIDLFFNNSYLAKTQEFFIFNYKQELLLQKIPFIAKRMLEKWSVDITNKFNKIYYPDYIQSGRVNINYYPILLFNLVELIYNMDIELVKKVLFLILIYCFLLIIYYLFSTEQMMSFNKNIVLASSRGMRLKTIKKYSIVIQLFILISSLFVTNITIIIFLYMFGIINWSYSYLVICSTEIIIIIALWIFQRIVRKNTYRINERRVEQKEKRSQSFYYHYLTQIAITILIITLILSLIVFTEQDTGNSEITMSFLWFISFAILSIFTLLVVTPLSVDFVYKPLIKFFSESKMFFTFILHLFNYVHKKRKLTIRSIFILFYIGSFIVLSDDTLSNYNEDITNSYYCYDLSISVESSSIPKLKKIVNTSDLSVIYIDTSIMFVNNNFERAVFIYLENPLNFYNGINSTFKFKKHSSHVVFDTLNYSDEYVITTYDNVKKNEYKFNKDIILYKNSKNNTLIEEHKPLFDTFVFIPFLSNYFTDYYPFIYLMRYNSSSYVPSSNNYALFSVKINNNNTLKAIFNLLSDEGYSYKVIHLPNQTIHTPIEPILEETKIISYSFVILAPVTLLLLLSDIMRYSRDNLEYLISKGLRKKKSIDALNVWLILLFSILIFSSSIYSVSMVFIILKIINIEYNHNMLLKYGKMTFLFYLVTIIPLISFILPSYIKFYFHSNQQKWKGDINKNKQKNNPNN